MNDNCPVLTSIAYLTPEPVLQKEAILNLTANDRDSGINADINFFLSPIFGERLKTLFVAIMAFYEKENNTI